MRHGDLIIAYPKQYSIYLRETTALMQPRRYGKGMLQGFKAYIGCIGLITYKFIVPLK